MVEQMSRSVHEGFTERFKQALEEAGYGGYDKKELGQLFGVSGQAVAKWLRGDSIPNAERAPLVAARLGVRRAWLLDNELPARALHGAITDGDKGYSANDSLSLSGAEFKLLTDYRQLTREQQDAIVTMIMVMKPAKTKR